MAAVRNLGTRPIIVSTVARLARQRAGFTVAELSRRSGVSEETIRRVELGRSDPRVETVVMLLAACEVAIASATQALQT